LYRPAMLDKIVNAYMKELPNLQIQAKGDAYIFP
jgi:hypothetical protein